MAALKEIKTNAGKLLFWEASVKLQDEFPMLYPIVRTNDPNRENFENSLKRFVDFVYEQGRKDALFDVKEQLQGLTSLIGFNK